MQRRLLFLGLFSCAAAGAAEDAVGLYRGKHYPEAQAAFESRLAQNPQDAVAHFYLGRLALARQQLAEAIPHFEQAVKLEPENAEHQFQYGSTCVLHAGQLGTTFRALGLARRGRIAMEKAVELAPREVSYREALTEFYSQAPAIAGGGMNKAYAAAEAIRPLDPHRATLVLAGLKVRDKRPSEAIELLDEHLRTNPGDYQALYLLGRIATHAGMSLERGIAALNACLAQPAPPKSIGHDGVLFLLGQAHEKAGDVEAARAAYEAALALEPAHEPAQSALNRLGGG